MGLKNEIVGTHSSGILNACPKIDGLAVSLRNIGKSAWGKSNAIIWLQYHIEFSKQTTSLLAYHIHLEVGYHNVSSQDSCSKFEPE